MKIRADTTPAPLPEDLLRILRNRRISRDFRPEEYLEQKTRIINDYFTTYGLNTAVIAVSGGIDSAVVLGILHHATAVKTIIPVMLPAQNHNGVTGQDTATERGKELCAAYGLKPLTIDIAPAVNTIDNSVAEALNTVLDAPQSNWGSGQLVSYTRTPFLYYLATMLADNGHKAVITGTTNYSEGSYLGYIGKASDAMVDLQIISDLHKSEVNTLAEHLRVPESIRTAAPTGDMFDDCVDEEVFGATYDFVELFLEYLNDRAANKNMLVWSKSVSEESRDYFNRHASSLKELHAANKHKYLAGSPAVHLDVRSFALNIWKIQTWKKGSLS